ncbi:hypothetical protein PVAP13_4NG179400 [Panicum virgatum]|uniref:Uncharacterized protein n=1 Tax=Panicum virgatum TaxID=38727 RepID=A0A8T0TDZ7_PANVG|nr:hypothetical protein PVAP13_4NG179400 [Panicum virgatum]
MGPRWRPLLTQRGRCREDPIGIERSRRTLLSRFDRRRLVLFRVAHRVRLLRSLLSTCRRGRCSIQASVRSQQRRAETDMAMAVGGGVEVEVRSQLRPLPRFLILAIHSLAPYC